MGGTYRNMDPNKSRNIVQLPAPGPLEKALAKIATELHYARPAGRLWPDLLLLPLAFVFCLGCLLTIDPPVLRTPGSSPGKETLFLGTIGVVTVLLFFLSLGFFGVIQGVGLKRPSSIVLGTVMLLILARASILVLLVAH
jgi:hypothetical protein